MEDVLERSEAILASNVFTRTSAPSNKRFIWDENI